jgi:ankyrin repeat protein
MCGFQDLVEYLVVKYPQQVNTNGGCYVTPLVAALAGRHFQTAKLLHHSGAHMNVRSNRFAPLISAAWYGDLEMVQVLLEYKAEVNATIEDWTVLHFALEGSRFSSGSFNSPRLWPEVARLFLERGADVNARAIHGLTPLHEAAKGGTVVIRVLLEHGANVGAEDDEGRTPLHIAADHGKVEIVRMLIEHGANVGAEDNNGITAFQIASAKGDDEIMKLLSEHGAKGVL